jgi:phenylalanyl-tRNA synthetase alpha chain
VATILSRHEHAVFGALAAGGERSFAELVSETGLDQSLVAAAVQMLAARDWAQTAEATFTEPVLTDEGRAAAEKGTPERQLLTVLDLRESIVLAEVPKLAAERGFDAAAAVQWLFRRKWARKAVEGPGSAERLKVTEQGMEALLGPTPDEVALGRIARGEVKFLEELGGGGADVDGLLAIFRSRKDLVKLKTRSLRRARLTAAGLEAARAGVAAVEEVSALTPELIASGRWREVAFKRFDVTLAAETRRPGKVHPISRIVEETRQAFLSMGFTEWQTDFVESGFWDFDALFQPQDHPAREMQDTFYLSRPELLPLPADAALVDRVRRTHEDGGDTGSTGWGYRWSAEKARQAILRTHTTATSIRALAKDPNPPRKIFTIGKVFRRETISYKHLPEFLQIDGIIIDEGATLATLKGTLTEYYRKLGFPKIRFKPSFFPYTEPSAEVYVFLESRDTWVELGGSGIFRPEVTRPLGCKVPVLAWGLGLERLALFRYGAEHIRALYDADLAWLREVPLCR